MAGFLIRGRGQRLWDDRWLQRCFRKGLPLLRFEGREVRFRCRNMREFRERYLSGGNPRKKGKKMLPGVPGANGQLVEPRGFIVLGNPETVKFPQAVNQLRGPHQRTAVSFVPLLVWERRLAARNQKSPPGPRLARAGSGREKFAKGWSSGSPPAAASSEAGQAQTGC
jgi:hypothetical protein